MCFSEVGATRRSAKSWLRRRYAAIVKIQKGWKCETAGMRRTIEKVVWTSPRNRTGNRLPQIVGGDTSILWKDKVVTFLVGKVPQS